MLVCRRRGNREKTRTFESSNGWRDRAPILKKKKGTRPLGGRSQRPIVIAERTTRKTIKAGKAESRYPSAASGRIVHVHERNGDNDDGKRPVRWDRRSLWSDETAGVRWMNSNSNGWSIELREQSAAKMTLTASTELFPAYFCRREWNSLSICHLVRNRV